MPDTTSQTRPSGTKRERHLRALLKFIAYHDKHHPEHEAVLDACADYPAIAEAPYSQMEAEMAEAAEAARQFFAAEV